MDASLIIGAFDSCKVVSSAFLIFLVILYVVTIDVTIKYINELQSVTVYLRNDYLNPRGYSYCTYLKQLLEVSVGVFEDITAIIKEVDAIVIVPPGRGGTANFPKIAIATFALASPKPIPVAKHC